MLYGVCNLSVVPLRAEKSDFSEMISQVLFGEHFEILEKEKQWSKIRLSFDNFEGFINNNQYQQISEKTFDAISNEEPKYASELVDFVSNKNNELTTITIGAHLPLLQNNTLLIENVIYRYDSATFSKKLPKEEIIKIAFTFLNCPYLWGGKTPFGIDCSGFTQMVYKLCGYQLLRNAKEQATQGEVLSFIEESEAGDLAFFDNEEGEITHVGIVLNNYNIIHVHGKVRIDTLDHSGIFNADVQKHTHKLRVIKKLV
ncbi:C40 family peptidase [Polaribacter tangerinus]|uniref:C40 family peptidase n=1 Tax=Polaribacter tangerinus TaxID=1920034 RepID=UPI000B4B707C|nr:C40 family peptidase [Polaribacter tangerinus]